MSRDARFEAAAARLGFSAAGELIAGGNYVPAVRHGSTLYIAGQIPKDGARILMQGRVGADVSVEQARFCAQICALRALSAIRGAVGSLDGVAAVLRLTVHVQTVEAFSQHSEVADGASDLLVEVLGPAGAHPRTSVGAYSLPKNVPVELDLTVGLT